VVDYRSKKDLDNEANIQKHLEKAMKTARAKRKLAQQKAKEHEERMKALAAAEAAKLAARSNGEESSEDEEEEEGNGGGVRGRGRGGSGGRLSGNSSVNGENEGGSSVHHNHEAAAAARWSLEQGDEPVSPSSPHHDSTGANSRGNSRAASRAIGYDIGDMTRKTVSVHIYVSSILSKYKHIFSTTPISLSPPYPPFF
jgi:hypothetical protein